jgi:hypothetical protein
VSINKSRDMYKADSTPCIRHGMAVSEIIDDDVSCSRNEVPLAFDHQEIMGGSI